MSSTRTTSQARKRASDKLQRRHQRDAVRIASALLTGDVIALAAVGLLLKSLPLGFSDRLSMPDAGLLAILAMGTLGLFAMFGLYSARARVASPIDEATTVAHALAFAVAGYVVALTVIHPGVISRAQMLTLLLWAAVSWGVVLLGRAVVWGRCYKRFPERVLIYGAGATGQSVAAGIMSNRGGTEVVGFVDDNPKELRDDLLGVPVFPESAGITAALRESEATRLVLAFSNSPSHEVLQSLRTAELGGMPVSIVPRYYEITPSHSTMSEINGVPMVDIRNARLSRTAQATKRVLDVALSGIGLLALSPLLIAVAIAIKLESKGPVIFRQERIGFDGKPFRMWKFRSMVADAEAQRMELQDLNDMVDSGPLFKIKEDPRITRVGRFIRRTSIDELPQLMNVMMGHMSLVGPRPFVTHEALQIDGWGRRRLEIKPGITGVWQVRGCNDVPFDEMLRLDYMYVANWSPWWDIRLILQTIPQVLSGRGAS